MRAPLPTLTEDEFRTECERVTIPAPMPSAELARQMMTLPDGDPPPKEDLEIAELPASEQADVVEELARSYLEHLGSRAHVPVATRPLAHLREAHLDHWAAFVLSLVDGATSIQDIINAAPMPEHDTLRLLCDLKQRRIIVVRPPR